ncbi:MAG: RNA-directed DNA polymerase [Planctomycetes bacterium]|nr:RNA-directed DNA polymerase [Planctomycetota bacterium]
MAKKASKKPLKKAKKPQPPSQQSLLDMTNIQARAFLLKPESYCTIDFPDYVQFGGILSAVAKVLQTTPLSRMQYKSAREQEGVNYAMLSNKDGRHAWRPLQLIHPVLYVSLVSEITKKDHWSTIRKRFAEFAAIDTIKCLSIPVKSLSKQKDEAARITQWVQGIEQGSIELALDYQFILHADITDCYAAMYTHSIAWALHERAAAKAKKHDMTLIGNIIDARIQDMRYGQTNGIPQGSVLMHLIAELVLGYADLQVSDRLNTNEITEYRILRYRDDYRIFVNNPQLGETILKTLTEVMIDLGLKLNADKTTRSQCVVSGSLKADKRAWLTTRQGDANLQKHLLVIHAHGIDFPNSGSLNRALTYFHKRLIRAKSIRRPLALISISVDTAYQSPRVFPACAAIISKLLSVLENDDARRSVIRKIHKRLSQLPNTGHMEVWLQRISHPIDRTLAFQEKLCRVVCGKDEIIWNNDWLTSAKIKDTVASKNILDGRKLKALKPIVRPAEIEIFADERY